ncbi:MAG: ribulose-phosphate 3-epimerase [Erysipelotrichaceae bacterium]|nr:ribulose-phosphate 3-epimerase [Erysipelotrichaceae bacterium]
MTIIAPSVLSLDYANVNVQMEQVEQSKAKWIHFDVMDGHFVPNLSFGPDVLKGLRKLSTKIFDVHIMVSNPRYFAEVFSKLNIDYLTFHYEVCTHQEISEIINFLKSKQVKVGLSIKPSTKVEMILPYLSMIDLVLVMSVEPGFGGQAFDVTALDKIKYLREVIDKHNYSCLIEVDGGINAETGKQCVDCGADVLVAGSYIFKGDIVERVNSLL